MCGRSGLLLEAWDVQTWGQSGRLGEVWKRERSASESMSLVFGLIVWKRGGGGCWAADFQRQRMLQNRGFEPFGQKKSPDSISEPPSPRRRQEKVGSEEAAWRVTSAGNRHPQGAALRRSRKFRV